MHIILFNKPQLLSSAVLRDIKGKLHLSTKE